MKTTFLYTCFALMAILLFAQDSSLEAKHHRRTNVQVGIGTGFGIVQSPYTPRRYVQPVFVGPRTYYSPVYVAPTYVAPVYVNEVYVAPRCHIRPSVLSFSWNFFK